MNMSIFDTRHYPVRPVADGYGEWAATYEQSVADEMDTRLLERIRTVEWASTRQAVDLACGTGRTGAWLAARGVPAIDGIDLTPAMLAGARARGIYRRLCIGNVTGTPFGDGAYDLAIQSLADEHLCDLRPLYREAARITRAGGQFVIVGYHPHFLMLGIQTHFHRAHDDEPIAIESYVHLLSDHVKAAQASGWSLRAMDEGVIDDDWVARKPKWAKHYGHPVSFAMVWQR